MWDQENGVPHKKEEREILLTSCVTGLMGIPSRQDEDHESLPLEEINYLNVWTRSEKRR